MTELSARPDGHAV